MIVNHNHSDAKPTLLTARIGPNWVAAPITIAHTAAGIAVNTLSPSDPSMQNRMTIAQPGPDLRHGGRHRDTREHHVADQQRIVQNERPAP